MIVLARAIQQTYSGYSLHEHDMQCERLSSEASPLKPLASRYTCAHARPSIFRFVRLAYWPWAKASMRSRTPRSTAGPFVDSLAMLKTPGTRGT